MNSYSAELLIYCFVAVQFQVVTAACSLISAMTYPNKARIKTELCSLYV